MADGTPASPRALIGASIPRSGHHFLQNLLSTYYGEQLYYCEYYSPPDCCRTFPCTRRGGHSITYQKSHDREQEVPRDIKDAFYVIQYRHPLPEALSDRELDLDDGLGRRSIDYRLSRDHYMSWLASKAIYYRKFHDKWMTNRLPNAAYLDYVQVAKDPRPGLSSVIAWASGRVDEALLTRVIDEAAATRVSAPAAGGGAKSFKPRVPEDSPNFDADLLGAFEAYVIERCPNFGFISQLNGSFEKHPLHGLIILEDADEPIPAGEKGGRFVVAARLAPGHPDVVLRQAQRDIREDNVEKALEALQELLQRQPYFGPGYKLLFSASKKAGKTILPTMFSGNSILGCSESPDLLMELASAFLSQNHVVNAISAISMALILAPNNQRANYLMASAFAKERRWPTAEHYAAKAHDLDPDNGPAAKLLARVRKRTA